MKKHNLFLWLAFLLAVACDPDTPAAEPVIEAPQQALHYDGPVQTAPVLAGGEYEAAARFDPFTTEDIRGQKLVGVYFYLFSRPASCTIKIYKGSDAAGPESAVYSAAISSATASGQWNYHALNNPITLENDDYWITVKFAHTNPSQTLGCDPGPAHPDGDWLLSDEDNQWRSFRSRTNNEASINWNIRGVVEP